MDTTNLNEKSPVGGLINSTETTLNENPLQVSTASVSSPTDTDVAEILASSLVEMDTTNLNEKSPVGGLINSTETTLNENPLQVSTASVSSPTDTDVAEILASSLVEMDTTNLNEKSPVGGLINSTETTLNENPLQVSTASVSSPTDTDVAEILASSLVEMDTTNLNEKSPVGGLINSTETTLNENPLQVSTASVSSPTDTDVAEILASSLVEMDTTNLNEKSPVGGLINSTETTLNENPLQVSTASVSSPTDTDVAEILASSLVEMDTTNLNEKSPVGGLINSTETTLNENPLQVSTASVSSPTDTDVAEMMVSSLVEMDTTNLNEKSPVGGLINSTETTLNENPLQVSTASVSSPTDTDVAEILASSLVEMDTTNLNEKSPVGGLINSTETTLNENPLQVSTASVSSPTDTDVAEILASSLVEMDTTNLNEKSPVGGLINSTETSLNENPLQVSTLSLPKDTDVSECRKHQLVSATISSLDKCVQCVGPTISLKWLGYKCAVCSRVWHKSCFRCTEDEYCRDLLHEHPLSEGDLKDNTIQLESNDATDDQCSSDEEYIPDSSSEDDGDSDSSIPVIASTSKTGLTQTKSKTPITVKLACSVNVNATNLCPPLEDDIVPSAVETSDSTTSVLQTKAGAQKSILTSTPVTTSNLNYCCVCGKGQKKIARHLKTHKTDTKIQYIFSLPKKSKERKSLLEKLRNEGNFKHNSTVLQDGTGSLKVKRKTKTSLTWIIHSLHVL
ncbi:uncharacterized protein LOC113129581 [Mastacembelus armatus]|uniref:uncharacterized protein LOC113129581 n=1 Tax=Mastacembelus armatus TaxID=205130 RepID=UPI000E46027A|nr:uncharacterized protein LOC113129581 [Mastacembelus armatus]